MSADAEGAASQRPPSDILLNLNTPQGTRLYRLDVLRRALRDARRRNDIEFVALLVAWLSDEAAV